MSDIPSPLMEILDIEYKLKNHCNLRGLLNSQEIELYVYMLFILHRVAII